MSASKTKPFGRFSRAFSAASAAKAWVPQAMLDRLSTAKTNDLGYGYDAFGMHPDWVGLGLGLMRPMYEQWFRVRSTGHHNIPASGAAILAANHSGTLPFDAMMTWADAVQHTDPVRVPRPIIDYFVDKLPFINTLFTRVGAVGGSRGNVHNLLSDGELLLLFPEGVPGISKPFSERYQLQTWRGGHVELAIRHRAPVVPVAVIGAEEQLPQLAKLPISLFGAPFLPITPTIVLPLPVRYHIYYGEPIAVHEDYPPEAATDPVAVAEAAARVKSAVEALIARGLEEREGVFA